MPPPVMYQRWRLDKGELLPGRLWKFPGAATLLYGKSSEYEPFEAHTLQSPVDGEAHMCALCLEGCSHSCRNNWNRKYHRTVSANPEPSWVREVEDGGDLRHIQYIASAELILDSDRPGFEPRLFLLLTMTLGKLLNSPKP